MSTDQPIPARQRQSDPSAHDTGMDATGQRIWSAYGSSPGLIDLDYASAPSGFSTSTPGAGSLSADIFARWGAHAGASSSRVPMPFAGLRLQRKARAGVRGTPAAAGGRRAAGVVVARSQELGKRELIEPVDGTSDATTPSSALPLGGPVPAETSVGAEPKDSPLRAPTPTVDRVARAQPTALTSTTRSGTSGPIPQATPAARREPLLLRATPAASRPPDAVHVSRSTDAGGGVDEAQRAAGTPRATDSAAAIRREPVTSVSGTPHVSSVGTSPSEIVRASSESEQVSAGPEVVAASGQSTPAEAPIRVQASARPSDVAEARQQDHLDRTAPSVATTPAAESVSYASVMFPRVPFQPLIWRKAATTWSSRSPFAGPLVSTFHPAATARWPLVSRTTRDGTPQNLPWTSGAPVMSAPRLADAHTEPDAPGRIAVAAVPPPPFHVNRSVVIARVMGSSTRTTPAVLAVPSGVGVTRVFRAAAVTPTGAVTPATGTASAATGTAAPATGTAAPAIGTAAPVSGTAAPVSGTAASASGTTAPAGGTTAPAGGTAIPAVGPAVPAVGTVARATRTSLPAAATTWIQHPAPTGSLLQRAPRPSTAAAGLSPTSTSRAAAVQAGDASTGAEPVTVVGRASSSVPFGAGTGMTASPIGRVPYSLFRSPLTLLARSAISYAALDRTYGAASAAGAGVGMSRTILDQARAASGPATAVEGSVNRAPDSQSPAIQRASVASNGDTPGVPAFDAMVTSASGGPGTFGSRTTFTPVLSPNLLLRTASPALFRSSRHDSGAFGVSELPAPTGHGAHELALTIIGRNTPATFDTTDPGSAASRALLQRSHAVDDFAPMVSSPGLPVSAVAASSQRPLREVATGRPLSLDVRDRASAPGSVYVFRKHTPGGTAKPDRSIETLVPPIDRMSALPMVQTEAANLPATAPPSAPAPEAHGNPGSSAQSAGGMDFEELIERVSRRLSRQLAIEHERRGAPTWR